MHAQVYLKNKSAVCSPLFWPYLLVIQSYSGVPDLCWFLVCLFLVSIYWKLFSAHLSMQSRA